MHAHMGVRLARLLGAVLLELWRFRALWLQPILGPRD